MNKIQQQQGVVLVISLVFLALMTIVGVTAMQGTTQEAKMANNAAQRALAFQYAEAGLRIAAASLSNLATNPFDNTTPRGLRGPVDTRIANIASYWMDEDKYEWKANSIHWCYKPANSPDEPANSPDEPANSPLCDTLSDEIKHEQRYVIEKLRIRNRPLNPPYEFRDTTYRITARSTGNVTDAVVILQATFQIPSKLN